MQSIHSNRFSSYNVCIVKALINNYKRVIWRVLYLFFFYPSTKSICSLLLIYLKNMFALRENFEKRQIFMENDIILHKS